MGDVTAVGSADYIDGYAAGVKAGAVAATPIVADAPPSGYKSTEGQLVIAAIALISSGSIPQNAQMLIAAIVGVYIAARTALKAVHTMGLAKAIPDLPEIPAEVVAALPQPQLSPGTTQTTVTTVAK